VPDDIFAVAEVPRTLSGKKQELPIKKLLLGQPIEKVVNKDAMANPGCLDWYAVHAVTHEVKQGSLIGAQVLALARVVWVFDDRAHRDFRRFKR
jgi:hypothetical protein